MPVKKEEAALERIPLPVFALKTDFHVQGGRDTKQPASALPLSVPCYWDIQGDIIILSAA
ncbi:hypothetical protein [Limihaloglobus sulfuriphilus]|uniref:hypothetical protein n=1 Tax=Limihaloglobus sulfuriphilus TaxID=1851148 RepID=UPI0011BA4CD0|nr:hypothetical protein [Limihaloglobus sulfuriphilus]